MKKARAGLSTVAIHGDAEPRAAGEPVAAPIVQSSTFVAAPGPSEDVLYTRYGNNPNQLRLAERLTRLEGAEAAIFVASGMGATALAHLAVLQPGDHLLSSEWIYGGTRRLFLEEFRRFGIETSFVNPDRRREWRAKFRKNTRAIFVETPGVGAVLSSPWVLAGTASVFEGSFAARLQDAGGHRIVTKTIQASQGAPGRGSFRKVIAFSTAATRGTLVVYDQSMKDGSLQNVVRIPVVFAH